MYKNSICFFWPGSPLPMANWSGIKLIRALRSKSCCFLGASAGSFVASILAANISVRESVSKWVKDGHRIFKSSPTSCYFICHDVIKLVGSKCVSPDAYKRANSRLFVSVSQCQKCWIHNALVSEFSSNEIRTKPYALLRRFLF